MLCNLLILIGLLGSTATAGALTAPTPQFSFTGFIQEATLDTAGAVCTPAAQVDRAGSPLDVSRLRGGTITVNGIRMIVPCNTILQMPAATFTWADLFDPAASAPVGTYIGAPAIPVPANPIAGGPVTKTGLALADSPMPFPSFAVTVTGNVLKNADGSDRYIVALIAPIEQQVLNGSSGLISYIDYAVGAFRVGGIPNDPGCDPAIPGGGPRCSGALVQFNDPGFVAADGTLQGRWGKAHSPDPRFSGDNENVTIRASTGIPVCIPRVAPPAIDPLCPLGNRPLNGDPRFPTDPFLAAGAPLKNFQMPAPADGVFPDARQQVPMMVGDQVNYVGTIYKIDPTRTIAVADGRVVPDNTPANTYMSAHTVEDVLGIFTAPGVPPAYVFIEAFLIGSGGQALPGLLQEASTRLTVVGFTTDPTRLVDIYAQDINPCTGQETLRLLATTDPATQPLVGRFVHRVLGGLFMPPTRYYVMKTRTQPADGSALIAANGIATGQYLLPNFEFVIPENHRLGDPIIPGNFQDFPFLALGSGPLEGPDSGTAVVGQLDPWPGIPTPTPVNCAAFGHTPVVDAGPDVAAGAGALVTLAGTVTWDTGDDAASRTVQWAQVAGDPVTLGATTRVDGATTSTITTTFTAPNPAPTSPLTFQLTATDNFGAGNDAVNIPVLQATDRVDVVLATFVIQRGARGGFGKLTVQATTSDPTAILSLSQVDTAGVVTNWGAGANKPSTPTVFDWVEIKGTTQPVSLTVTSTKGGKATVTCGLPNAKGAISCP
jgi:hypothetical protein